MRDAALRRAGRCDLDEQAEADETDQREGLRAAIMSATGIA
jgi:hypothetical protein